jgi:hypothetical protein
MSAALQPRPWFKPRDTGTGWTPVTWQGWLVTAAFCLLIAATVQLVIPQGSSALPWSVSARRALGLSAAGLGLGGAILAIGSELGAFLAVAWWTSRPTKRLD